MLIRFGVENHLSIRDYEEVSLVASSITDTAADVIATTAIKEKLLPAAVMYGANGSGKTNMLGALPFLRDLVLYSHRKGDPDTELPVRPFLLDSQSATRPTSIDCEFIHRGVRYVYGVSLTKTRVEEEYLYAYPKRFKTVWYERQRDDFKYGRSLKGENSATEKLTRPNSLFLSAASNNNHQQLSEIHRYFQDILVSYDQLPGFGAGMFKDFDVEEAKRDKLVRLLGAADFGIVAIESKRKDLTESDIEFRTDVQNLIKKHIGGRESDIDVAFERANEILDRKISLLHKGVEGKTFPIDLSLESRGTQTFLNILCPVLRALEKGQVLLIDELDTSLHTLLAAQVLGLFNSKTTNPNGAQLIFTTHDTNLLSPKHIRRDQVWFTERNVEGCTHVYPLSDIAVRKTDDFEKGYLEGRYGAVPILGEIRNYFD